MKVQKLHLNIMIVKMDAGAVCVFLMENVRGLFSMSILPKSQKGKSDDEDPSKFVLIEVYRSFEDTAKHKMTEHYVRWRDAVSNMMEEPRSSVKFYNVFPEDEGWE